MGRPLMIRYHSVETFDDDKILPHRMREISDQLKKEEPGSEIDFYTRQWATGKWELKYTIWKPGIQSS